MMIQQQYPIRFGVVLDCTDPGSETGIKIENRNETTDFTEFTISIIPLGLTKQRAVIELSNFDSNCQVLTKSSKN